MLLDFECLRLTSRPNQFLGAPKGLPQTPPHEESPVFGVTVESLRNAFAAMIPPYSPPVLLRHHQAPQRTGGEYKAG